MNANKASPPPPPPSSDEGRENIIILTPASTTVSDEGELATKNGNDNNANNNNKNTNNNHNHNHHTHNENRNDNDRNDINGRDGINGDRDDGIKGGEENKNDGTNFGWNTTAYGRRQGLLSQVGSLSKELTELKAMIARSASASNSVSEEQAEDLTRVKANHRSSLASLAESHRTEISSLINAHQDEIKRLEQAHIEDMRNARRGFGFGSELVQGLHQSYAKQIESLVLDLSEVKRQLKNAETPQPPTLAEDPNEESLSRRLNIILSFDNLDNAFSIAEISIPHPGRSFRAVWKHLSHVVTNYLQTLNSAAQFFAEGPKALEARKIRHWHQSACGERIQFRFLHGKEGDDMKDLWESELWESNNFTLRVVCEAEAEVWNDEGFVDRHQHQPVKVTSTSTSTGTPRSREPLGPASEERLVQVETPGTADGFNVTAELDRINRVLGVLEINDNLHDMEDENDENKENIEHPMPKRHAMVEEVTDEEDHLYRDDPEDEGVGLAISSSPVPATPLEKEPLLPRNSGRGTANNKPLSDNSYLEKLLGTDRERERQERKTTSGSSGSDSWLFDELFSPSPADKGKGKEKMVGLFEEREQDAEDEGNHFGGSKSGWKWVLPSDGAVKASPTSQHTQQYFKEAGASGPWLEKLREEEGEDEKLASDCDQPVFSEQGDKAPERKDRLLFSFGEEVASSPAPPPAPPAPELRKMDNLPAYLRAEIESSVEGARLDEEDSDIDDNQPRDGGDIENPFADLKPGQCDTPVMGTSRSAASTTPLLRDGSPAPRNQSRGGPPLKIQTDTQRPLRGLSDPFVPLPKPPKFNLPQHKQPAQRYRGYGPKHTDRDDDDTTFNRWEETASEVSGTTTEGCWETRHQRKCGRGKGPEAYTWHHELPGENDSFRSRSPSPPPQPPSRSSVTTTDRNLEFILPSQTYQQQTIGLGSNGGNIGSMRYGSIGGVRSMGPLGPGHHGIPAGYTNTQQQQVQADVAFQQQMKLNELVAAANYLQRPSNGPPSFIGGPVYAPNPPHSVATFNGGVPVRSSAFMNIGSTEQRLASEGGGAWPMRPLLMQPHLNPQTAHLWGPNGELRRSYSTDSAGPLLGLRNSEGLGLLQQHQVAAQQHAQAQVQAQQQQQAQQAQQQQNLIPGPLIPPQQGTRPPSTMSMSLEQAAFGNAAGLGPPWAAALANAYGQPGTPGSAHTLSPGWFALQQAQQGGGTPAGFENMWGVPAHWGGAFGG